MRAKPQSRRIEEDRRALPAEPVPALDDVREDESPQTDKEEKASREVSPKSDSKRQGEADRKEPPKDVASDA